MTADPPAPVSSTTSTPTAGSPDVLGRIRGVSPRAKAGVIVQDRRTKEILFSSGAELKFRSASLVKLLIAIDVLERYDGDIPNTDQKKLYRMLADSYDQAASDYWVAHGGSRIVERVATRLGLSATKPPTKPGRWGDTIITARDMLNVYQHLLGLPAKGVREPILDPLREAPRIAADGFDQHFGIPRGLPGRPWAIKQGWSNGDDIAVHTSGLVGEGDRYIVVLLIAHPLDTPWAQAMKAATAGAAALAPLLD